MSSHICPKEISDELLRPGRAVALSAFEESSLHKHSWPFRVGVMIHVSGSITDEPLYGCMLSKHFFSIFNSNVM